MNSSNSQNQADPLQNIYFEDFLKNGRRKKKDLKGIIFFLLCHIGILGIAFGIYIIVSHHVFSNFFAKLENTENSIEMTESLTLSTADESVVLSVSEDVSESIDNVIDSAKYHWIFQESINEQNGLSTEIFGDTRIIDIGTGNINAVAYFDGDGDYIDCGKGINLDDNFTFSIFFRCDDVNKAYSAFFAKYETNYKGAYAFSINKGHINIWITTDEDKHHAEIENTTQLINGEWYYITIVKKDLDIMIYLNGQLENQMHIDGYLTNDDTVTIGRQALMFSPEDQLQFTGAIADIAIYDFAMDSSSIMEHYMNWEYDRISDENELEGSVTETQKNKRFEVYADAITWEEARKKCVENGGHLTYITCEDDYNAILSKLSATELHYLWVGATTTISDNKVYASWLDGTSLDFINDNNLWYPEEPSGRDMTSNEKNIEPYVMLWNIKGEWTFNDNSDISLETYKKKYFGYVCEFEE